MLLFYINFGDRNPLYPALGSNIPSARRRGQRFHFLHCGGSSPSLRFVNRHGGTLRRAGWVAFTKTYSRGKWLISHLLPTLAIIIHIPRPLRPCIWRPLVPVPHVPASQSWRPQVPRLASPNSKSPHTRPDVPVPLSPSHFYTQPSGAVCYLVWNVITVGAFLSPQRPTRVRGWRRMNSCYRGNRGAICQPCSQSPSTSSDVTSPSSALGSKPPLLSLE